MGDYGRETTFSHNIPNRNEQKKSVSGWWGWRACTQEGEMRWGQPGKTRTTKRKRAAVQDPPFYCKQSKEDPQLDPYEKHSVYVLLS